MWQVIKGDGKAQRCGSGCSWLEQAQPVPGSQIVERKNNKVDQARLGRGTAFPPQSPLPPSPPPPPRLFSSLSPSESLEQAGASLALGGANTWRDSHDMGPKPRNHTIWDQSREITRYEAKAAKSLEQETLNKSLSVTTTGQYSLVDTCRRAENRSGEWLQWCRPVPCASEVIGALLNGNKLRYVSNPAPKKIL